MRTLQVPLRPQCRKTDHQHQATVKHRFEVCKNLAVLRRPQNLPTDFEILQKENFLRSVESDFSSRWRKRKSRLLIIANGFRNPTDCNPNNPFGCSISRVLNNEISEKEKEKLQRFRNLLSVTKEGIDIITGEKKQVTDPSMRTIAYTTKMFEYMEAADESMSLKIDAQAAKENDPETMRCVHAWANKSKFLRDSILRISFQMVRFRRVADSRLSIRR